MKTLYEKSNKVFLTPACGENSAVVWDVEVNHYEGRTTGSLISGIYDDEEDDTPKTSTSVSGDLYIMDCHKRVCLEFSLYSSKNAQKEAERKLEKLDLLISELSSFRDHLAIAYAEKIAKDKEVKE